MSKKTLESSIADRLNRMSGLIPADVDAFENHLTILENATIEDDHGILAAAVAAAAQELRMAGNAQVGRVLAHLRSEEDLTKRLKARQMRVA